MSVKTNITKIIYILYLVTPIHQQPNPKHQHTRQSRTVSLHPLSADLSTPAHFTKQPKPQTYPSYDNILQIKRIFFN